MGPNENDEIKDGSKFIRLSCELGGRNSHLGPTSARYTLYGHVAAPCWVIVLTQPAAMFLDVYPWRLISYVLRVIANVPTTDDRLPRVIVCNFLTVISPCTDDNNAKSCCISCLHINYAYTFSSIIVQATS